MQRSPAVARCGDGAFRDTTPAALLALALVCLIPRPASGQLCHPAAQSTADRGAGRHQANDRDDDTAVEAAVAAEAALLDGADAQGMTTALRGQWRRLGARLAIPVYRIAHDDGDVAVGLGDLAVEASARLLGGERWRAGVVAGVTAPTGDADDGLGMGHAMLMPGAWITAAGGPVDVAAAASYGTAVGDPGGHHHHRARALVNPMNRHELGGSLRAAYAATGALEVHAIALLAVPVGDGVTRAAAAGGARWHLGTWSIGAEAGAGITGKPFVSRGVLDLTRTF
jgi:hypothetical protein